MKTGVRCECVVSSRSRFTAATPPHAPLHAPPHAPLHAPPHAPPHAPLHAPPHAPPESSARAARRVLARSRSSPVRCRDAVRGVGRARSPSASPPRGSPQAHLQRDNTCHRVRIIDSAYFSSRPPKEPLRLVHCATRPEHPALPTEGAPGVPRARSRAPQRRHSVESSHVVLGILYELVTQLPLRAAPLPLALGIGPPTLSSDNKNSESSSKENRGHKMASRESPPQPPRARCGARGRDPTGGQDRAHSPSRTSVNDTEPGANGSRPASANSVSDASAEWVGGVRALRDSHVRFVLRQLRHIHRLNRTLDAAAAATHLVAQAPIGNVSP